MSEEFKVERPSRGRTKAKKATKTKVDKVVAKVVPKYEEVIIDESKPIRYAALEEKKSRTEKLAWGMLEEKLKEDGKGVNALIKMVLEPHFPKTKVNLTAKIDLMPKDDLLDFMKSLVDDK